MLYCNILTYRTRR